MLNWMIEDAGEKGLASEDGGGVGRGVGGCWLVGGVKGVERDEVVEDGDHIFFKRA